MVTKKLMISLGLLCVIQNLPAAAIHRAARLGSSALVQGQLNKGVSPNARDQHGNTPLHLVRNKRTATILLANSASVNAKNNYGVTPLHLVPLKSSLWEMATLGLGKLLLQNGADVRARDNNGNTPLHDAARLGAVRLIKKLIARGADVHAQNDDGITPLHAAVGLIQLLPGARKRNAALGITATTAASGITYYFASRAASTAAVVARHGAAHDTATALATSGLARTGPLYLSQEELAKLPGLLREKEAATLSLKQRAAPWGTQKAGILDSGFKSQAEAQKIAQQKGQAAAKTAYGTGGKLPAIVVGVVTIAGAIGTIIAVKVIQRRLAVKALLNAGANVNALDNLGNTPLHFMATGSPLKGKAIAPIARVLTKAGADISIKNNAGYTAFDIARKNYRFDLMVLLRPKRS